MTYSVLACEGAHDQAALSWLARICAGWVAASDVPPDIRGVFDPYFPRGRKRGGHGSGREPTFLLKDGRLLVIRSFGGKGEVLKQASAEYLGITNAVGIGVIVDADNDGVDARVESFRTTYGGAFPHAREVTVGAVWGDQPRLGFWVAPDNTSTGEMDDALVKAARRAKKELLLAGDAFIKAARKEVRGKWVEKRQKALLGTVFQVEAPGASLASALERGKCWFDESITEIEPFGKLVEFIDAIGSGAPATKAP